MSSGDISVFWQEIIDSYRDIMVVKNSANAKSYLDLTDVEYQMLSSIATSFTMSRLSYHFTILESAMADMQRATNSRRSIAEIALTRMCDPKLVASVDALLTRVEELEKQISMLKLGVVTPPAPKTEIEQNMPVTESVAVSIDKEDKAYESNKPYEKWGMVKERIGELKRSLSSQLTASEAYKIGPKEFVVRMSPFFADRIKGSVSDFSILKGVIAELEGIEASALTVTVEGKEIIKQDDLSRELDNLIK